MSVAGLSERSLSLPRRLWIYQGERIPILRTGVLSAVFASAGINVSAILAGRPLPPVSTYLVAAFVTLAFFILLRVADEVKDAETDARFRPERPVPRGLVDLSTLVRCGVAVALAATAATALLSPRLLPFLGLVVLWMALMSAEFFVPRWLKARPVAYLVSHMAVVPLIDLFTTACEWAPTGNGPPPGLGFFIALSFANGAVLEIGRKCWAPSMERPGVESYSALWGPRRAVLVWMGLVAAAFALALLTAMLIGPATVVAVGLTVALAASAGLAGAFFRAPSPRLAAALDSASGLWVFVSYIALGWVALLLPAP